MENLERAIARIKEALPGLTLLENENMAEHCSFKIGGPVRAMAVPQDVSSLSKICYLLKEEHIAPYMLGNGTNILFPDEGLKDLFIISTQRLTRMFQLPDGAIYAEAGVSLAKLASFAQQNGLQGLEFASGIPGSVGGGLIMNAGAYGGELKDTVESVVLYYLPEQRLYELTKEQCAFGYRSSLFQKLGGCVILSAVFRLEKGQGEAIAARMRELNQRRREKQDAFNKAHGIVPRTIIKSVRDLLDISAQDDSKTDAQRRGEIKSMTKQQKAEQIARLEKQMKEAAKMLEFELAAALRDQIIELRGK